MFPNEVSAPFPFCAVVGQERAQRALLLHAINPRIGSVLLCGETGTAKTTLVRGLAALLPQRRRVVVPVHVTEDRLFGALNSAAAFRQEERRLAPGLLSEADEQMMSVDDVQLMSEPLLRSILQTAENGSYRIEREGLSELKTARFLLFGTIHVDTLHSHVLKQPLSDQWGLFVQMEPVREHEKRQQIIRRCLAFERNKALFVSEYETETRELLNKVTKASLLLSSVHVGKDMLRLAAEISREAGCQGHRAEMILVQTATAIAAWEGQTEVKSHHVQEAAPYVIPHRMRDGKAPNDLSETPYNGHVMNGSDRQDEMPGVPSRPERSPHAPSEAQQQDAEDELSPPKHSGMDFKADAHNEAPVNERNGESPDTVGAREIVETIGRDYEVFRYSFTAISKPGSGRFGKRNKSAAGVRSTSGRYVRAMLPKGPVRDLALDATLRAAAPFQRLRHDRLLRSKGARVSRLLIETSDLREKVREARLGTALLFVVDASGSMNASKRMKAVKGAIVSLLRDAYRQRDGVGLIAFRGEKAELMLNITRSVELAERKLRIMPTGGKTPLSAALRKGAETLEAWMKRKSGLVPAMIVITDGKANVSLKPDSDPWNESLNIARRIAASGIQTMVIDTEAGFVSLGFANKLAEGLRAAYYRLEQIEAGNIERAVRSMLT